MRLCICAYVFNTIIAVALPEALDSNICIYKKFSRYQLCSHRFFNQSKDQPPPQTLSQPPILTLDLPGNQKFGFAI